MNIIMLSGGIGHVDHKSIFMVLPWKPQLFRLYLWGKPNYAHIYQSGADPLHSLCNRKWHRPGSEATTVQMSSTSTSCEALLCTPHNYALVIFLCGMTISIRDVVEG